MRKFIMKIKLTEQQVKETFGNLYLVNAKVNRNYQTDVVESVVYHVAGDNSELESGSYAIKIFTDKVPNIKPMGRVRLVDCIYSPRAQSGAIEGQGNARATAWAKIVDNFEAREVLPFSDADKLANEDGEKVTSKK